MGSTDRINVLYSGKVKLEGINLNFLAIHHSQDVFDRVVGRREFDAFELSALEYICHYAIADHAVHRAVGLPATGVSVRIHCC